MGRDTTRLPTSGPKLAEAIGRALFKAEPVTSDYARCVQISRLLHDSARHLADRDPTRATLLRQYADAVSEAGNAL